MTRPLTGTAAALTVVLVLTGCSRQRHDATPARAAPAAGFSGASVTPPGVPPTASGVPAVPGIPGDPGAPTGPGGTGGTGPAGVDPDVAGAPPAGPGSGAAPSRPAGHITPPIDRLRLSYVSAKVTRGGRGPCYGIVTTAGVAYAAYSSESLPLAAGDRIRILLVPGDIPVDCGAGQPARVEGLLIGN